MSAATLIPGFRASMVEGAGATLRVAQGGSGPAVVLLHGYPQTHAMWHGLAPELARRFTVVAPDLRGYGESTRPPAGPGDAGYSKRAMGGDVVAVMSALGHERFAVVGHDRGGRVGHRLALDHPDRITRLCAIDIVPTRAVFRNAGQAVATGNFHWFFLIQPGGLPERMIGADPGYWLDELLRRWSGERGLASFAPGPLEEYRRCFRDPEVIAATCADYRAAATTDLEHDEADIDRAVTCPLLALWGADARIGARFDVVAEWRARAADVRGRAVSGGHFLVEESPEEMLREIAAFLGEGDGRPGVDSRA